MILPREVQKYVGVGNHEEGEDEREKVHEAAEDRIIEPSTVASWNVRLLSIINGRYGKDLVRMLHQFSNFVSN